jgi:transglutaminase-like putative cysteine protease
VVPLLEMSPEAPGSEMPAGELSLRRGIELQWQAPRAVSERLRFQASAYLDYRAGPLQAEYGLQAYLALPRQRNPRTLAWAEQLRHQARFEAMDEAVLAPALAEAVMQHIRSESFGYTLLPGRYGELSPHLIDEFWFDRRLGFCEHFASAFVVVMRAMGVPARVVTGFQGADRELQDGYLVVRNSQAHAWAEYWTPGQGWLRADPTAAVAPERVNGGQALRPTPGLIAGALGQVNPALWLELRRGWETLDNRWQQVVLGYARNDQFKLLQRLGFESPDWAALGQLTALLIALVALAGAVWTLWQARPHDAWSRQRAWLRRELRRLDVPAELHQGPREWAGLLQARHGPAAAELVRQLLALERARYGATPARHRPWPDEWLAHWRQQREFRRAARPLRALSNRKKPPLAPSS